MSRTLICTSRVTTAALVLASFIGTPARAAAEVTVTVRVRTTEGRPIPDAYVALVPMWRPPSKPLVEEITEKGSSVLRVPAGTYQLLAGARGFAASSHGPVDVTATAGMDLTIELAALRTVIGTIRDGGGRPISGARVSTVHAIPLRQGSLSEMAIRHLGSDWKTIADERGKWSLEIPTGAVPLLFEALGYAARWQIHKDTATLDVSLARGATLEAKTDRIDRNLIVTLSREDADAGDGVLPDEQARVLARWAEGDAVTWSSLPPGTYGVYAKYPDPRYFDQTAAKLTTVTLARGEERTIRVTLPPVKRAATVTAALFLPDVSRSDLTDELETFGRDAQGRRRHVEQFVEEVIGGTVVHLKTDGIRPPLYATTADRFFSTVSDLTDARLAASTEPWLVAVDPRADAHFHVRFIEKDLQIPRSGVATLRGCAKSDRVTVPIDISELNAAEFIAPAGCRSMVLEFDPFESVVTDRVLLAGDQSLGEFVLRAAGFADVRVVRQPGGALVSGATVQAISDEMSDERSTVVREASTDETGWAHLTGLPSYWKMQVVASTDEGDKSDAAILRVQPRERGLIDPLVLPEPAALIVDASIDPAFLSRFPAARIVTLFLRPADPGRQSEQRQENTPETPSPMRFERLHPGRWLVSGVVSVAGTYSLFEVKEVLLKPGEEQRVEATISPNVFEGVITSEGKGIAAKIILDDRDRKLYFSSNASGVFRATLENKGIYRVAAARLTAQGNLIPIGDVAFTDSSRRMEIAIPTGARVTTRVRRGDQPVTRAVVWLSRRQETGVVEQLTRRGQTTNSSGEAVFDDVSPGGWTFSVRENESGRAAEKTIAVEGGTNVTVHLEMARTAAIEGAIRDGRGSPLPRATVECLFLGPSGAPDLVSANADAEGEFAIELIPPAPSSAFCSVTGALGTVEAFKAVPGQRHTVTMPRGTAKLQISDWFAYRDPGTLWLVAQDGRLVSLRTVARKIGQFGSPLTIPALSAGVWMVVRVESFAYWLALATGRGASLPALRQITLRPGTEETISLNDILTERHGVGERTGMNDEGGFDEP